MKAEKEIIYLIAGGTGGHINGALALGDYFTDYQIKYISSQRDIDKKILKGRDSWHLPAMPLKGKNIFTSFKNIFWNTLVFFQVFFQALKKRPVVAIGLGGFICGPALLACYFLQVPIYIVEQNSVMGMTNKLLAIFSKKIFTHFKKTKGLSPKYKNKVIQMGNPIRNSIRFHPPPHQDIFNLLIFGGSLGANEINEYVQKIFSKDFSFPISIKHQVGLGNEFDLETGKNIQYEQLTYIDEMDKAYQWSHFIMARGGASSISELNTVARPCFIFPYPHQDQHQYYNALNLQEEVDFPVQVLSPKEKQEDIPEKIKKAIKEARGFQIKKPRETLSSAQRISQHIKDHL